MKNNVVVSTAKTKTKDQWFILRPMQRIYVANIRGVYFVIVTLILFIAPFLFLALTKSPTDIVCTKDPIYSNRQICDTTQSRHLVESIVVVYFFVAVMSFVALGFYFWDNIVEYVGSSQGCLLRVGILLITGGCSG
jgi:hypothetical protein